MIFSLHLMTAPPQAFGLPEHISRGLIMNTLYEFKELEEFEIAAYTCRLPGPKLSAPVIASLLKAVGAPQCDLIDL